MSGKLISLEGLSGMGKTYYYSKLKEDYKDNDNVVFLDEITDGNHSGYSNDIFEILYSTKSRFFDIGNPKAEVLLGAAKRAFDDENIIMPYLNEGKTIIVDRSFDSICLIEGSKMAVSYEYDPISCADMLYDVLGKFIVIPDKTILLDGNLDDAVNRAEIRDIKRFIANNEIPLKYTDKERKILYTCGNLYRYYADLNKDRITTIDRDRDTHEVYEDIKKIINKEMKKDKEKKIKYENYTSYWKLG